MNQGTWGRTGRRSGPGRGPEVGRRLGAGRGLALAAGVVATVAGVALALAPAPRVPDAGALPPVAPASPSPPPSSASAAPVPLAPVGGSPRQVRIGALGVAADVDPVGVDRTGRLAVPADPRRLGWWIGAARPGDAQGTVLVAGHVDTADAGPGALFRLETLPVGAAVEVTAADRVFRYTVTARRSYAKARLPADLFSTGGPPRLVLITCGGGFHEGAYDRNVVVFAT